jgi:methionyl-tRNA synthetase
MSRILITSALPYINGIKHLGNLAGSMLPADVWARFMRARGHDVLYVCATDEHGTPAEIGRRRRRSGRPHLLRRAASGSEEGRRRLQPVVRHLRPQLQRLRTPA